MAEQKDQNWSSCSDARTLTYWSTTQQCHTAVPHSSTTQKYHTEVPHSSTTQKYHTAVPHRSTTQFHTAVSHSSTTQQYHTEVPHSSTTQQYHTEVPHSSTTQKYHTEVPHSSTTQQYNFCGTYMYNRGTTQVPQKYHRTFLYHRITTQWLDHYHRTCVEYFSFLWYSLVQQGYHKSTTELPQEILKLTCTTGLPQNLCGIFFIPVVISVVLTCTTGVPQKYHRTFLYHRITTQWLDHYHRTCVVYFSFLW